MAINTGYIINGTIGNICGYMSRGGRNIIRKKSSLTGARVKKDRAFQGFRESGNRMKEASPIASSLYSLLPKETREYPLYRTLTGEALNMLKQGMAREVITDTLHALYIQPVLASQYESRKRQKPKSQTSKDNFTKRLTIIRPIRSFSLKYIKCSPPPVSRKVIRTSVMIRGRPNHGISSYRLATSA